MEKTPPIRKLHLREQIDAEDLKQIPAMASATGFFSPAEIEIAFELAEEKFQKKEDSSYRFLFADKERETLGFSCFGLIPCTLSSYDLYWIVVSPEAQGTGIGTYLIGETERRIASLGGTRVYVDTSGREQYRTTRAFYESRGYRQAAVLEDFYGPSDAKIIYCKYIKDPC